MMTIRRATALSIMLLLAAAITGCHKIETEVVQGVCLAYDQGGQQMTVQDERAGTDVVFDLSQARIGLKPEKGNTVRVAYRQEEGRRLALKVMNVTRQDLRKQ